MSNETILREALNESLDFLTALLNRRNNDALDLLMDVGEDVEAAISEAIARTEREQTISDNDIAELARQTVEGWGFDEVIETAINGLYEFWSSPEGADDLAARLKEEADDE